MEMNWMKRLKILRWQKGEFRPMEDLLAEEGLIHVELGRISFDVSITPRQIRPFVYGHLLTEGFIRSKGDVMDYFEYVKSGIIHVKVRLKEEPKRPIHREYNIIWSECGLIGLTDQDNLKPPIKSFKLSAEEILKIPRLIGNEVWEFKQTGAYHYAFLFSKDLNLIAKAGDIGRHNAVDKVIGEVLLEGDRPWEMALYITGRISMDIVFKCLRAGIPLVISRSAPLLGAVELADRYGLGVIGFLRGGRFNLYSGHELIVERERCNDGSVETG
ncbi:TPA: formate dehydrogenase accessory sulfurtransferase FdhD [Candidatus Poribacteria bacterium]|nr:formate dehydrogenase accessory sulfurtransferase FdhD [Candidatus Poribacteria bacterium]